MIFWADFLPTSLLYISILLLGGGEERDANEKRGRVRGREKERERAREMEGGGIEGHAGEKRGRASHPLMYYTRHETPCILLSQSITKST